MCVCFVHLCMYVNWFGAAFVQRCHVNAAVKDIIKLGRERDVNIERVIKLF